MTATSSNLEMSVVTVKVTCQRCLGHKAFLADAANYKGPTEIPTFCGPCQRDMMKPQFPRTPLAVVGRYCSGPSIFDSYVDR